MEKDHAIQTKPLSIGILGAGAAGLMAVYCLSLEAENWEKAHKQKFPAQITLIDRNKKPGKKLLATGNGKCNISHEDIASYSYYYDQVPFLEALFQAFSPKKLLQFLENRGLLLKTDPAGRIYPHAEQAKTVLDFFLRQIKEGPVTLLSDTKMTDLLYDPTQEKPFVLQDEAGHSYSFDRLLLAVGGCSGKNFGTDGSFFPTLQKLGLAVTPLSPSLVPLKTSFPLQKDLKGVRAKGTARLFLDSSFLAEESGEIQFTEYGLSGIAVMNLSRHLTDPAKKAVVELDFFPHMTEKEVMRYLEHLVSLYPQEKGIFLLDTLLQQTLGRVLMTSLFPKKSNQPSRLFTKEELLFLAKQCKGVPFPIAGTMDFSFSQVTRGGVKTEMVYPGTMESKTIPHLYLAGEMLDVDGPCGGLNLTFALLSGYLAGQALFDSLRLS